MHVKFSADHDYTPSENPRVTIAYRAGWSGTVRNECGVAAVQAGRATEIKTPRRRKAAT